MDEHCSVTINKSIKDPKCSMTFGETYISKQIIEKAVNELKRDFDKEYGGFGKIPKYPTPHSLCLLLKYYNRTSKKDILKIIEKTLLNMYKGGFFDHVGLGFFRYSTDKSWLVPSFQKTLQDNALLAIVYAGAYEITRKELYKEIAEKIIIYVLRDMTNADGVFYSADGEKNVCEVASLGGINTDFYTWSIDEIEKILGKENGQFYCKYYNITNKGNVNEKSIPNLINTDLSKIESNRDLKKKLNSLNSKLYLYRQERELPKKNYKISTFKNGLMIASLAYVGAVLNNTGYINEASDAANSAIKGLFREDGRLLEVYEEGKRESLARVDDYAAFIWGLIEMYESTCNNEYLNMALSVNKDMIRYFWCEREAKFLLVGNDETECRKENNSEYNDRIYVGNSIAALNMTRLIRMTNDKELQCKFKNQLEAFENKLMKNPNYYTFFTIALIDMMKSVKNIAVT